jgi:hypothetical protein
MYARVVRFTDVTPERVDQIVKRVEESEGPPPGVPSIGLQFLYDESQGTAVFVGLFENEEKMREGAASLEQMDASDTPGTKASVDMCEVKIERRLE